MVGCHFVFNVKNCCWSISILFIASLLPVSNRKYRLYFQWHRERVLFFFTISVYFSNLVLVGRFLITNPTLPQEAFSDGKRLFPARKESVGWCYQKLPYRDPVTLAALPSSPVLFTSPCLSVCHRSSYREGRMSEGRYLLDVSYRRVGSHPPRCHPVPFSSTSTSQALIHFEFISIAGSN